MTEALSIVRTDAQLTLGIVLFFLCMMRGGGPERGLSCALVIFLLIDCGSRQISPAPSTLFRILVSHLLLDTLLLASLAGVAVNANRRYPLWMGGAQIGAVTAHVAPAAMTGVTPLAFALMNRLPIYLELAALAAGLVFHVMRERQPGFSYPDWRPRNA